MENRIHWIIGLVGALFIASCKPDFDLSTTSFVKYIGGEFADYGVDIAQLKNGGYLVLCNSATFGHGTKKMTTVILDTNGNFVSAKAWGSDVAWDLAVYNGGFLALGGIKEDANGDARDFTLTYFSASGDSVLSYYQWQRSGSDENEGHLRIQDVADFWISGNSFRGIEVSALVGHFANGLTTPTLETTFHLDDKQINGVNLMVLPNTVLVSGALTNPQPFLSDVTLATIANGAPNDTWKAKIPSKQYPVAMESSSDGKVWILANEIRDDTTKLIVIEWDETMLQDSNDSLLSKHYYLKETNNVTAKSMVLHSDNKTMVVLGTDHSDDLVLFKIKEDSTVSGIVKIPSITKMQAGNVIQTDDGGFVIVGTREINGDPTIMVIKIDDNGKF